MLPPDTRTPDWTVKMISTFPVLALAETDWARLAPPTQPGGLTVWEVMRCKSVLEVVGETGRDWFRKTLWAVGGR